MQDRSFVVMISKGRWAARCQTSAKACWPLMAKGSARGACY